MMDNCCAPQWADFTHSPQVPADDYFNVEHEIHESVIYLKSMVKPNFADNKDDTQRASMTEADFDDSLESTPSTRKKYSNTAFFIPHDNKKRVANEEDLNTRMRNLKLDKRSSKIHQSWSIPVPELTSGFKKPTTVPRPKPVLSEKNRSTKCISEVKNLAINKSTLKANQDNAERKDTSQYSTSVKDTLKDHSPRSVRSSVSDKRSSYKVVSVSRRRSSSLKLKQYAGKSYPRVLTCQYRRQSLKYRRGSNKFISLAEAVSKFQNGTPKRFRTISNNSKPSILLKQEPLKLTHPVSPALRSKKRARTTKVLTQEERENLELEEMRKHQIKANPIPVNILKAPSVLRKVVKKPTTVTKEFHLTQSKNTRHTVGPSIASSAAENKGHNFKSSAPITRSNSASNVHSKQNNPTQENFVARNKEYMLKKEEKLKNLQVKEINKIKTEFHARPAPKFPKVTNVIKEQAEKKRVIPCPFSFEQRDKSLAKKKEELVKHMKEKVQEKPVFHAKPVPTFKPVMVHGLSKENVQSKEQPSIAKKLPAKQRSKSCNDQENKQPNIVNVKKDIKEGNKKQVADIANIAKSEKPKVIPLTKFELNTDKRAKERCQFEEKIKRKEVEMRAKREELEKSRLLKEKMERAELRKMAEVKARPMPVYKPITILKSTKPPVSPRSPGWASRPKLRSVS